MQTGLNMKICVKMNRIYTEHTQNLPVCNSGQCIYGTRLRNFLCVFFTI